MPVAASRFGGNREIRIWDFQRQLRRHFNNQKICVHPTIHTVEQANAPALMITDEPDEGLLATVHLTRHPRPGDKTATTTGTIYAFQDTHKRKKLLHGIAESLRKAAE